MVGIVLYVVKVLLSGWVSDVCDLLVNNFFNKF